MAPRSLATAPLDAVSFPFATTGGHALAQAPEHFDASEVSANHR
jgi:hypothetical protein